MILKPHNFELEDPTFIIELTVDEQDIIAQAATTLMESRHFQRVALKEVEEAAAKGREVEGGDAGTKIDAMLEMLDGEKTAESCKSEVALDTLKFVHMALGVHQKRLLADPKFKLAQLRAKRLGKPHPIVDDVRAYVLQGEIEAGATAISKGAAEYPLEQPVESAEEMQQIILGNK